MPNRFVSVGDDFTLPADVKAADANLPARLQDTALNATFVTKWKPNTAYLAGDKVLSPGGDVVSAKVNFTSGASFSASNWDYSTVYALKTDVSGGVLPDATVAGFGDSMLGDQGSLGLTTLTVLGQALGVNTFGGGVPGQTSTEIALRQGGLDVFVTVAGNTIPASGAVGVTIVVPSGVWKAGAAWTFSGTLAGVAGTLAKDVADVWTFTRTTAGSATTVQPETRWISTQGTTYANRVQIFRAGRNNSVDENIVARDVLAMSKGMSAAKPRYLVLPVYNTTSQPSGSAGYTDVKQINDKLSETHGPNYYDLRGWIIRNGLAAAGITPTTEDTTAIAEDRIPPSLMHDSTHMNKAGRIVEGNRIAAVMVQKGWFPSYTPVAQPGGVETVTVTNLVFNPRVAVNTLNWSTVAGTGGTAAGSQVTSGGPLTLAPSFYRATWSVSPTGQAQITNGGSSSNLVTASKQYRVAIQSRASWAGGQFQISIGWYNGATFLSATSSDLYDLSANAWTAMEAIGTAPATATRAQIAILAKTTGTLPPVSGTLDMTAIMFHETLTSGYAVPYRDGDASGWAWSGTAHLSPSSGPITTG